MGASNGTRIIMEAFPSMNMPTISRKILTTMRNTILLWMVASIHSVSI